MKRRDFVGLIGGAAAWSVSAHAQQASGKVWRAGFLFPGNYTATFEAWKRRLRDLGYIEGQNLVVDHRFADNDFSRLPQLAAEMVAARPDAVVAVATPAVQAIQKATGTIPIVMAAIADPVGSGYVKSLARPGGRITGTSNMTVDYMPKTVELLRELLPALKRVAALMSENPMHPTLYREVEITAAAVGIDLVAAVARTAADLDAAFDSIVTAKCQAVIVFTDAIRLQIIPIAAAARLPVIYQTSQFVDAGGLISYGANNGDLIVQTAVYVDKIFKGADPADLPVEQPTRFELAINLKTAKQLGLSIPATLLARADRVIE